MKLLALFSPMAMFADFFMGLIACFFAYKLLQKGKIASPASQTFIYSWSLAILLLAIGVFFGGIIEGTKESNPKEFLRPFHILLAIFVGGSASVQVFGTMHLTLREGVLRSLLFGVGGAGFAIYTVIILVFNSVSFKVPYIILNMLGLIGLFVHYFLSGNARISQAFSLGIIFQILAVFVFFGGFGLPGIIGTSLLFDLLMMIGLYFYYKGIMEEQLEPVMPYPTVSVS